MKSPLFIKEKTNEPPSFFDVYIKLASPNQQKIIALACCVVAVSGSLLLGLPILFKDPKILCLPSNEICFEDTACDRDYYIDLDTGPTSFSADFGLICEKKSDKTFAITMNFLGIFLGTVISTFVLIRPRNRQFFLSMSAILIGGSLLGMILVSSVTKNFLCISVLIFSASLGFVYINLYSYLFLSENFEGELAGFVTIMFSLVWGIAAVGYAILGLLTNADWKLYCGINGTLSLIAGFSFMFMKNEHFHEKEENNEELEKPSFISYFRDMWPNVQIRRNFLIYSLSWGMNAMVYSMILVEIESLGGNLYLNFMMCSLLEISATMATGCITKKYNGNVLLKLVLTILSIDFCLFFFCPPSLISGSSIQIVFFVFCLLVTKVVCNINHIVTYLILPKVLTDKYTGFWMLFSRFWARFITLFVPTVSVFMRSLGFHPFVFYGIFWTICRILFQFTKEVQSEGVEDLLNAVKATNFETLSIVAGSFANGVLHPDHGLANIKRNGVPLSVIRRSRIEAASLKSMNKKDFHEKQEIELRDRSLKV